MKDIDFDELDKAVSSVLGRKDPAADSSATAVATEPAAASAEAATVEPPETGTTEQPVDTTAQSAAEDGATDEAPISLEAEVLGAPDVSSTSDESVVTAPAPEVDTTAPVVGGGEEPSASAAPGVSPAARRGKFMDVMHPSADMNPEAEAPTSSVVSGTQRKTISPLNPDVKPEEVPDPADTIEQTDPLSSTVADVEATAIPNAPDPAGTNTPAQETSTEMPVPDPLDTPSPSQMPVTGTEVTPANEAAPSTDMPDPLDVLGQQQTPTEEAPTATAPTEDEEKPSETPFIPGVAVDKRPLGQPESASDEPESQAAEEGQTAIEDATAAPESPQLPANEPAPRELQEDIVQTENTHETEETDATVPSGSVMTPEVAPEATTTPQPETATPAESTPATNPLFDTQTYNQPLADTAAASKKKTPRWVWLAGLAGCLLVGGGVGVALFYLGF